MHPPICSLISPAGQALERSDAEAEVYPPPSKQELQSNNLAGTAVLLFHEAKEPNV